MQQQKIFITGATGLLGRSILFALADKFQITALKRDNSKVTNLPKSVNWVEGNLSTLDEIELHIAQADIVIHVAAKVTFSSKQAEEIIDFNIEATKNVVDACLDHHKRLIHISSVATLGDEATEHINENSAFNLEAPNTDYALSKYFSEVEVWRGIAEGLDAVILNPTVILGVPATYGASSHALWHQVNNGLRFYPKGITGFVDARDIAEIVHRLIYSDISGQRFIVNADDWSYQKFFAEIAKTINKKAPQHELKNWQGNLYWRLSAMARALGVSTRYTKALHLVVQSNKYYDASKIKQALNFEFRPVEESIAWVSESF